MNWDDLRFIVSVSRAGSLARAAVELGVDHTTVGRRIDSAERALGIRLFTRTSSGYVPTADAERLLGPIHAVEAAVHSVERGARAEGLSGPIRVTSPETFGISVLAPRLATFGQRHPGLVIELVPSGDVLDLGRREAEIAVRFFRTKQQNLVARRVGDIAYGFYASEAYLKHRPLHAASELAAHAVIASGPLELAWLARLNRRAKPTFTSPVSLALAAAAKAGTGVAILPRYLGDADAALKHVPMPNPPTETAWLTVHRDLRHTPRVRVLLDFLAAEITAASRSP